MSLSDLSEDIFDAIFLEIFPGNADGIIKDVLNVYKVLPLPCRTKLQTYISARCLPSLCWLACEQVDMWTC